MRHPLTLCLLVLLLVGTVAAQPTLPIFRTPVQLVV